MNDKRYPEIVYKLLLNLDSNGRYKNSTRYDFGVVWITQELGD